MKDDRVYLLHILECIDRVERYCAGGHDSFLADVMLQDAVLRNLQVLSESTQRLSEETKSTGSGVPWHSIAGFRNVLVHGYLGVNLDEVWQIIVQWVPALKQEVKTRLETPEDKGKPES